MSYILDALQRAEAERQRDHVPGLKSQLVAPTRQAAARRPWRAVLALIVALTVLALGWWAAGTGKPAPQTVSAPAAPTAPPPPQTTSTPLAAPTAPAIPPERAAAVIALPILAPARAPAATAKPTAPATDPSADSTPATPSTATPARKDVPTFGELSPEARAQLPNVNVNGSTYSKNPALRTLIANGKVVQEGQDIAPGLRLETIGPRNAVLNHQGLRYSIGY
ncbi:general secretion pathway protein GspB [Hydrogenophaga sp.]|uniref:general secretion pathway protein GspB n=1 Tax=Hydrogenophaga sp. TaxID=1904254 RepID=UPI00273075F0|nr:general secretion pathway protein GspB [Hydrogenophaga sp.]MDP2017987.1 general secretion pathway protein GspB [Hydrogenophaga sp.]MDP3167415.1 general secretion pathway protein GspB [Hydrogenophaga sp.]